jgi:hypothetical protein
MQQPVEVDGYCWALLSYTVYTDNRQASLMLSVIPAQKYPHREASLETIFKVFAYKMSQ